MFKRGYRITALRLVANQSIGVRLPLPAPQSNWVPSLFQLEWESSLTRLPNYIIIFRIKSQTFYSMNKYYVYTLLSLKDSKFYVGLTTNLRSRLQQHARGEVKSTKNRRPLKLIHYEYFINEQDAKAREVFLKSGFGRNQLKQALKRTLLE